MRTETNFLIFVCRACAWAPSLFTDGFKLSWATRRPVGVAGNTSAWWLFRHGGQNVDVRGAGREVLRKMGLERAAMDLTTGEAGTDRVDEDNRVLARFAVADISDGPTAELEIMRGDIARMIYEGVGPSDRAG
jgi:hypothetical protein